MKKNMILAACYVCVWCIACLFLSACEDSPRCTDSERIGITVFIHGTVGVSVRMFGSSVLHDFRKHPLLLEDQLICPSGLHEFDLQTTPVEHVAPHIIAGYDRAARLSAIAGSRERYLLFGWDGALSQESRKAAGFELYTALCDYRDDIINRTYATL